jgi:argininosuccinate synthase
MKDSLDPVMRNIEAFLEDTQKTVNGIVTVLKPHFTLTELNLRMI